MSKFLDNLAKLAERNNSISKAYYDKYDVKRGLRNKDGSGVLVGLTEIGDVHGYTIVEKDINPVEGKLSYRGYNLTELIASHQDEKRFGFEETIYLLLFGELPSKRHLELFRQTIGENLSLPHRFNENMILSAPSKNIMNKLARSVLALYTYDENPDDTGIANVLSQSIQLIARFPALIAYGYQARQHYFKKKNLHIRRPKQDLSIAENFLHLMRVLPNYTQLEAEIMDMALVLHAEHGGGNNSTFAVHVVTSSDTDTYSSIAAAIGSLKGPKHGGANKQVMDMMQDIKNHVKNWEDEKAIAAYLEKIVRKKAHDKKGLIYGMGHPVYTHSDPRAVIFKKKALELAKSYGDDRLREMYLYLTVEKLAPRIIRRVRSIKRPVSANIDFFSGFVYSMLGIPEEVYTPIFAMSRVAGWCAHRIEELVSGGRIIRPAYKSVTKTREMKALSKRR